MGLSFFFSITYNRLRVCVYIVYPSLANHTHRSRIHIVYVCTMYIMYFIYIYNLYLRLRTYYIRHLLWLLVFVRRRRTRFTIQVLLGIYYIYMYIYTYNTSNPQTMTERRREKKGYFVIYSSDGNLRRKNTVCATTQCVYSGGLFKQNINIILSMHFDARSHPISLYTFINNKYKHILLH